MNLLTRKSLQLNVMNSAVERIDRAGIELIDRLRNYSVVQLSGLAFIATASLPWFGLPVFDSQPFPIMTALLFLLLRYFLDGRNLYVARLFVQLGLILLAGLTAGFFYAIELDFYLIRGMINYFGFVIYLAAFYEYIRLYGFPVKLIVAINLLHLVVALIQLRYPFFVDMFVFTRTSEGRGVTSLTPEPTYFAVYLLFVSWIYLIYSRYAPATWMKYLIAVNLLSILLLARSTVGFLFLLTAFFIVFVMRLRHLITLKTVTFFLIFAGLTFFALTYYLEDTRLFRLIGLLFSPEVMTIVAQDGSINSRLKDIVFPIHGFIYNYGLPGGLHSFDDVVFSFLPWYDGFFWAGLGSLKIMSWNLVILYELGIAGILFLLLLYRNCHDGTNLRRTELLTFFVILFASIPLAFPYVAMIFSIWLVKARPFRRDVQIRNRVRFKKWLTEH